MSYLGAIRLHFSGQFQADVSTVNNDVRNFNNATFDPAVQVNQVQTGSAAFRLIGCRVRMVGYADGTTSRRDPVVGLAISDADTRVPGKLVDLDPQQQLASEIWGLIVRLRHGERDLFAGPFHVAAFCDIWWARAQASGGDMGATAFWQSVIGPVTWSDDGKRSRFLRELRAASPDGLLSIKFNVDGYSMDSTSGAFLMGRIVGTIGPASEGEPRHFVAGRHLLPKLNKTQPAVTMNFMPAVVDTSLRRVFADFGNSLPTREAGGRLAVMGDLDLGWLDGRNRFHSLGTVAYRRRNWYPNTAGIQAFPHDGTLTKKEIDTIGNRRLAIARNGTPILEENYDGLHARADRFSFRLEPGETAKVHIRATRYGKPLAHAKLFVFNDSSGLQPAAPNDGNGSPPPFGVPKRALHFKRTVKTDAHGLVTLSIRASDPKNPRGYIDGQVYGVRYILSDLYQHINDDDRGFGWNPSDFVSLLVFDVYDPPLHPTWHHLQPIFEQYGNLYPVMGRIINLGSFESVKLHARLLSFAFGLPLHDPNYMPVTRDLSRGKLTAILRFLANPKRGSTKAIHYHLPTDATTTAGAAIAEPRHAAAHAAGVTPRHGSKTYAVHTRGEVEHPGDGK